MPITRYIVEYDEEGFPPQRQELSEWVSGHMYPGMDMGKEQFLIGMLVVDHLKRNPQDIQSVYHTLTNSPRKFENLKLIVEV